MCLTQSVKCIIPNRVNKGIPPTYSVSLVYNIYIHTHTHAHSQGIYKQQTANNATRVTLYTQTTALSLKVYVQYNLKKIIKQVISRGFIAGILLLAKNSGTWSFCRRRRLICWEINAGESDVPETVVQRIVCVVAA